VRGTFRFKLSFEHVLSLSGDYALDENRYGFETELGDIQDHGRIDSCDRPPVFSKEESCHNKCATALLDSTIFMVSGSGTVHPDHVD
jgi:hypothetical protein